MDNNLHPQTIADYIISRDILDKKTVIQAITDFNTGKSNYSSFSDYLVGKKLLLNTTWEKIREELIAKPTEVKSYNVGEAIDPDISEIKNQIEQQLNGQENALAELLEPRPEDVERFLKENGIDWQGRRMSPEEKASLVQKISELKGNEEVNNGVFVLSWMNNLLNQ